MREAPSLCSGYEKPRRYEDRGLSVTVMKRKSSLSVALHKIRFNGHGLVFFQKVLDQLKTGQKEKVDWPVECLPIDIGFWFFKGFLEIISGRLWTIWMRGVRQSSVSINFLRQK